MPVKTKVNSQLIDHQKNVISVACSYSNIDSMTIDMLARFFRVSENTISNWLCEAIEKRYITSDELCQEIMKKHVAEYEAKHNLSNSCLRQMYQKAFASRKYSILSVCVDNAVSIA